MAPLITSRTRRCVCSPMITARGVVSTNGRSHQWISNGCREDEFHHGHGACRNGMDESAIRELRLTLHIGAHHLTERGIRFEEPYPGRRGRSTHERTMQATASSPRLTVRGRAPQPF